MELLSDIRSTVVKESGVIRTPEGHSISFRHEVRLPLSGGVYHQEDLSLYHDEYEVMTRSTNHVIETVGGLLDVSTPGPSLDPLVRKH